ncbi:MAG: cobalt ECF transporter T component CbiQ [Candidatus Krumholzibacteriota bacterium]|nr:cobalt ECF transporter T component CbiQ [Candidatus Krumholzibacteriota bacterium]
MSCVTHYTGNTCVHRLDPRTRLLVTLGFSLLMALSNHSGVLCVGVVIGMMLAALSRLPLKPLLKRLARVNLFMFILFLLVPVTFTGRTAFSVLSIDFSSEGLLWSTLITLKANAIVLVFAALVGTVEPMILGHAFFHLRVPAKLTHLFLFTLRYLDLFHHQYITLLRAMKARAFRPRMNLHSYRSYAFLLAMLLVRSLERSERIMAAMKCRGFKGKFHIITHFRFQRRDLIFCILSLAVGSILLGAIYLNIWRIW